MVWSCVTVWVSFLQLPAGVMPWTFDTHTLQDFEVQSLTLTNTRNPVAPLNTKEYATERSALLTQFVRAVSQKETYASRLAHELDWIERKRLVPHLLRALDVLALAGTDVPHVTRGSCGSSLVCYLLGISHVDPVAHNICFARFLNEFRSSLPDIDFDFPHDHTIKTAMTRSKQLLNSWKRLKTRQRGFNIC